ncbi:RELT-like protein 2 isoform X2 [Amia ocellicauda]
MADQETTPMGDAPPTYMLFLLVLFFFLTGLLGFLICHVLKKKGYRCRTGEPDEECEDKLAGGNQEEETEDTNQDTVEQILKCIIENEANVEALKEMLGNQNVPDQMDHRLPRKESVGTLPPHHHTVHSGSDRTGNACHLCVQGRTKKARGRSRVARSKARPGEHIVFSVGRFKVTHIGKKNSISETANPSATEQEQTGDQSQGTETHTHHTHEENDQSQGNVREEFNLRNMFKDVSPETANGAVQMPTGPVPTENKACPETEGADLPPPEGERNPSAVEDVGVDGVTKTEAIPNSAGTSEEVHHSPVRIEEVVIVSSTPDRRGNYVALQMEDEVGQMEDGKDDMMEMEDIKDCRVSQEEEGEEVSRGSRESGQGSHSGESKRRSIVVHTQHK